MKTSHFVLSLVGVAIGTAGIVGALTYLATITYSDQVSEDQTTIQKTETTPEKPEYTEEELAALKAQKLEEMGKLPDEIEPVDTTDTLASTAAPFFYAVDDITKHFMPGETQTEIHKVDPSTGEDAIVYSSTDSWYVLYAVPNVDFNDQLIVNGPMFEGGFSGTSLNVLNTVTETVTPITFQDQLPYQASALTVSPDGNRVVALYDDEQNNEMSKEIVIYDIFTGERTVLGSAGDDEFLSREQGMGGAYGYEAHWVGLDCVQVLLYEDSPFTPDTKKGKEYRTFCEQ